MSTSGDVGQRVIIGRTYFDRGGPSRRSMTMSDSSAESQPLSRHSTFETAVHVTCARCHHWHNKIVLRLSKDPDKLTIFNCKRCGQPIFGLGSKNRSQSTFASQETDPRSPGSEDHFQFAIPPACTDRLPRLDTSNSAPRLDAISERSPGGISTASHQFRSSVHQSGSPSATFHEKNMSHPSNEKGNDHSSERSHRPRLTAAQDINQGSSRKKRLSLHYVVHQATKLAKSVKGRFHSTSRISSKSFPPTEVMRPVGKDRIPEVVIPPTLRLQYTAVSPDTRNQSPDAVLDDNDHEPMTTQPASSEQRNTTGTSNEGTNTAVTESRPGTEVPSHEAQCIPDRIKIKRQDRTRQIRQQRRPICSCDEECHCKQRSTIANERDSNIPSLAEIDIPEHSLGGLLRQSDSWRRSALGDLVHIGEHFDVRQGPLSQGTLSVGSSTDAPPTRPDSRVTSWSQAITYVDPAEVDSIQTLRRSTSASGVSLPHLDPVNRLQTNFVNGRAGVDGNHVGGGLTPTEPPSDLRDISFDHMGEHTGAVPVAVLDDISSASLETYTDSEDSTEGLADSLS
ncbi:MAG: hypothetical protein M1827_006075 [Pycnora praestabilis]|nr:MAG: hypothetical protein M1827_006075 [Pycnora praestabilis]